MISCAAERVHLTGCQTGVAATYGEGFAPWPQ